ncbi:hypothetical protein MMAD_56140 (plasmid) [Mycolicibacterium madagascariense]|uniref:FAD/NAD(P)-binding domain-containing protein n=1 Tax=Mycolicibacterium madagascariense TaxID=212765 RepID=A0A7I7XQ18_9MYCO|nr:hypothetical protein MMAD_56140 [Mycolicibacterium madagascariense]
MNMTKKLLILGAGIGGLSVVHELVETGVDLADLDVTVIDEDFSHFLGFTLPWVMRGWRDRDSVAIRPTADALADVETITGAVQHVDPEARVVTLATGELVSFDALVIATGARNAIGRVPGLQDAVDAHTAVHYYSADAAADANRALSEFTGGKLVFLVTALPYRCPVAPYEGAMLAADLLHDNGVRTATQISVHSPEPQPMPSAGPSPARSWSLCSTTRASRSSPNMPSTESMPSTGRSTSPTVRPPTTTSWCSCRPTSPP